MTRRAMMASPVCVLRWSGTTRWRPSNTNPVRRALHSMRPGDTQPLDASELFATLVRRLVAPDRRVQYFTEAHRAIDAEGAVLGKKDRMMFVGCWTVDKQTQVVCCTERGGSPRSSIVLVLDQNAFPSVDESISTHPKLFCPGIMVDGILAAARQDAAEKGNFFTAFETGWPSKSRTRANKQRPARNKMQDMMPPNPSASLGTKANAHPVVDQKTVKGTRPPSFFCSPSPSPSPSPSVFCPQDNRMRAIKPATPSFGLRPSFL